MKKIFLSTIFLATLCVSGFAQQKKLHTLIVVFDGLRPDYITPELMPNVYKFKQTGVYGARNHSVFPTVTRVNASAYATGSYPEHSGILGNTIYLPQVHATNTLNTGDAASMQQASEVLHGQLLTAQSFGEILESKGERFMVFSSGSTGQAFFQNHKAENAVIINPDLVKPAAMKTEVEQALGIPPVEALPNTARHIWVTDALMLYALKADGPQVAAIWYSDPDGAAHETGMGTDLTNNSIREVDRQFGHILATLQDRHLQDDFNIIITADHGFVTYAGQEDIGAFLVAQGLKQSKDSDDVILAGSAVYVKDHDPVKIRKIVRTLQAQPWIGAIFTKPQSPDSDLGIIPGTLSFSAIHWNHPDRAADILADVNWNDNKNAKGYAGTSFSRGLAGHGSSSPYEIHIPLIAAGPSFKKAYICDIPTSNVDLVPTILQLHNMTAPAAMDGRVMNELLEKPAAGTKSAAKSETVTATVPGYKVTLYRTSVDGRWYVDYTKVER
jgi:arylsulfatase A-like enzyme